MKKRLQTVPLITEIVYNPQRFAAISKPWDELAAAQGSPLALHAWYSAAAAVQLREDCQLWTILIWHGEQLEAAAPLLLDRTRSPARLVPIDAFAGEPDRLLFRGPTGLAALARACAAQRQPILFRRIAASEVDRAMLASGLRSKAAVLSRQHRASAAVHLSAGFEDLEARMSSSRRATIRRKWRAANREYGAISTEFLRPKPAELPHLLGRIATTEGTGWKGQAGTSLNADSRMGDFIHLVAAAFAERNMLILAYLKFGTSDAACRLILQHGSDWFEIKIGYDEQFARYSPGVLLMHKTLREACRTGTKNYHFLGLHEGWQDHWPNEVSPDFRLSTYPLSLAGLAALAADGLQALESLARRQRG